MIGYFISALILFVYSSTQLFSQFTLEGNLKNYGKLKKVYLYEYNNNIYQLIDTTDISSGKFIFNIGKNNTFKILKLRFSPDQAINNIIFYNENIVLETNLEKRNKFVDFIKSKENQIYQDYRGITLEAHNKEKAIRYLKGFYKSDDNFYKSMQTELEKIKSETQINIRKIVEKNKNYLVSRIIKYEQIPVQKSNGKINITDFLRDHYWDNFDFTDTILIHLPLFASKINDFFTLFEVPNISHETQEKIFQLPTNLILSKSQKNTLVFNAALNKLLNDTYDFGLRSLYNYIVDNYVKNHDSLFSQKKISTVQEKYKKNDSLKINSIAPNIKITNDFNLYDIKKNRILVVFWESDCVYCFNVLQNLASLYDSLKIHDFEVVAISLDKDPNKFKRSILERGYNWINYCDFKGWFTEAAKRYDVTSTPTMFLLDGKKRIISKPINIQQLLLKLKE